MANIVFGYERISVDVELDKDNTSIENQKDIINNYAKTHFPDYQIVHYSDRDRSGYTFEQREHYQEMRPRLMSGEVKILIVKDFSRFARRNSKGLVELEDLRDAGVRIISIEDGVDYPTNDDWLAIQFRFLVNEMPITDSSKKVKAVINMKQANGQWICAVPYGYVITNTKTGAFQIDEPCAEVVRLVFKLYTEGWGYKRISNYLTDQKIPTPRMIEIQRKEARGEECRRKARPEWSIITVCDILHNDFYIGTLRQRKYTRTKINGKDKKLDESENIIFENHHEPIVDYRTFLKAQEQLKSRTRNNYRGKKKYDNVYSGVLFCGDCGSPMFSMSREDLKPAYICGAYHRRGIKACSSHHTRVDLLDKLLKRYIKRVRDGAADMIEELTKSIRNESAMLKSSENAAAELERQLVDAKEQLKATTKQKIREIAKKPEQEEMLNELYDELEQELADRITGLQNQLAAAMDRRNSIIRVNREAKTAFDIFDDILQKETLDKSDLEIIIDKIVVYEDRIDIQLKADIDNLLRLGVMSNEDTANFEFGSIDSSKLQEKYVHSVRNQRDKVYTVNVISEGDPLEIFTDRDGEVIFKKYSPMGEMGAVAGELAEALARTAGMSCAICDRDAVIAAAGGAKKDILEKRISAELEQLMEQRVVYERGVDDAPELNVSDNDAYNVVVAVPIITEGDVSGCVVYVSEDEGASASEVTVKLCQTAAQFMAKRVAV